MGPSMFFFFLQLFFPFNYKNYFQKKKKKKKAKLNGAET